MQIRSQIIFRHYTFQPSSKHHSNSIPAQKWSHHAAVALEVEEQNCTEVSPASSDKSRSPPTDAQALHVHMYDHLLRSGDTELRFGLVRLANNSSNKNKKKAVEVVEVDNDHVQAIMTMHSFRSLIQALKSDL
jgi:hypothetical protein